MCCKRIYICGVAELRIEGERSVALLGRSPNKGQVWYRAINRSPNLSYIASAIARCVKLSDDLNLISRTLKAIALFYLFRPIRNNYLRQRCRIETMRLCYHLSYFIAANLI